MARIKRQRRGRIYARQSWRKEESISIDTQIEHCTLYAQRQGIELVGEPVIDVNLSGRSFKNRGIGPLIQEIEDGVADTIIVWKWSRWGRSLIESLLFMAQLQQAEGKLESATEPMDATTTAGRFSTIQMLAIADFESMRIGDMWKDAKRSMVFKHQLPPTGGARLGYHYVPGKKLYLPDDITAPLVKKAYEDYVAGASFHAIVNMMRENGVLTSRKKAMTAHSLQWSMESGFAAGLLKLDEPQKLLNEEEMDTFDIDSHQQLLLPGSWDNIIDMSLWNEFRAARGERKAMPPKRRNATVKMDGFPHCAGCGKKMTYRADRKRWTCATGRNKATTPCVIRVSIDNNELEAAAKAWLAKHRDGNQDIADELMRQQMEVLSAAGDIKVLEGQLEDLEAKMKNLVKMVMEDKLFTASEVASTKAELNTNLTQVKNDLIAARRRQAVHKMPTADSFGAMESGWDEMSPSVLNRGLKTLLNDVMVYPFRDEVRVRFRGTWQRTLALPVATAPDLDFTEGRTCLACKTWKPRSEFYIRSRGSQLMSRCKQCKSENHAAWRDGHPLSEAS